jgi:DNA recombination protein RmuC
MEYVIIFAVGTCFGATMAFVIFATRRKQDSENLLGKVKESLGELSLNALSKNTDEFLKIAGEKFTSQRQMGEKELEGKKELIDQTLSSMKEEMQTVKRIITDFEADRNRSYGELTSQLTETAKQTKELHETTGKLQIALAGSSARGKWGEKAAEDILKFCGFLENIDYLKQKQMDTGNSRPDFTFRLPQEFWLNMDVKFPWDNYHKFCICEGEIERKQYAGQFLKDVRDKIKEVTKREYIDPAARTVDYVLLFIPNEQVFRFVHENDDEVFQYALEKKVIICSPFTLYAVLVLIRQAMENFKLEKAATEILSVLGAFNKQWGKYLECFEKLGKKIKEVQDEFDDLTGTRRKMLDAQIKKVNKLIKQKDIPEIPMIEDESFQQEQSAQDDEHSDERALP